MSAERVVTVEWMDSCSTPGWRDLDSSGACRIKSVGYLISKSPKSIVITTSISNSGKFMDQLTIPTSAILKSKGLRRG